MENKEYNKCKRKVKQLITKDKYGKMRFMEFIEIAQWFFIQGYKFGVEDGKNKR